MRIDCYKTLIKVVGIGLLGLGCSLCAYAEEEEEEGLDYVVAVRSGFDSAKIGHDQALPNNNTLPFYQYSPNEQWKLEPNIGGFFGVGGEVREPWRWQLGIGFYFTSPFDVDGTITQNNLDKLHFWNYQFKMQNRRLLLENRWSMDYDHGLAAYAEIGGGVAHNRASDFKETHLDPAIPNISTFKDHSEYYLTYFVGLGVTWDIFEQWRLGVGYRYADLGRVELGEQVFPDGSTSDSTLVTKHLYSNELLVELNYLFDFD